MERLPNEVCYAIKEFLDVKSLCNLRLVNCHWLNVVHHNYHFVFQYTSKQQLPLIWQRLQKYNSPIRLTFNKPKCQLSKQDYIELGKLTNLVTLHLDGFKRCFTPIPEENLWPLTNLSNLLELDTCLPLGNANAFINRTHLNVTFKSSLTDHLTNLTKLQAIKMRALADSVDLQFANPNKLTKLKLVNGYLYPIKEGTWNKLSNLKVLKLGFCFEKQSSIIPLLPNLEYLSFMQMVNASFRQLPATLTTLEIGSGPNFNFDICSNLTALKHLDIGGIYFSKSKDLMFMTGLTNLEKFGLEALENPLTLNFLNSQKLTELSLRGLVSIPYKYKKLTNIQVLDGYKWLNPDILERCPNLTALDLTDVHQVEYLFEIIEELTQLKKLRIRAVDNEDLFDPNDVLQLRKLTALQSFEFSGYIRYPYVEDMDIIAQLPLTHLNIGWTVDKDVDGHLSKITSLETLSLGDCRKVTDQTIASLTSLNRLTCLVIREASKKLTGVTLTLLTSLERLVFSSKGSSKRFLFDKEDLIQKMPYLYDVSEY